ncbi:MAG: SPASM domain-containing protein, partial [Pseudobdellovibrio sp.]
THKNVLEFLTACRERNFVVSVLSNFSYMNEDILDKLHALTTAHSESLNFVVNLSAANAKTYVANRPNQKESTFEKVISDLKYTQRLRERDGRGITFSLMSVTNKLNYHDMPELIALAKDVGAENVWIKPIEVHGDETLKYLIPEDQQFEYSRLANLSLILAKKMNVTIFMPKILESLVEEHQEELKEYSNRISIEKQIEILCEKSALIRKYYLNPEASEFKKVFPPRYRAHFPVLSKLVNDVTPQVTPLEIATPAAIRDSLTLGVTNAGLSSDFYDQLPCKIGHQYFRVEVLGNASPCCISNITLDNVKGKNLKDIWLSDSMDAFRDKMNRISIEKFHRTDPEWMFCQQCPHTGLNQQFHRSRGVKVKSII